MEATTFFKKYDPKADRPKQCAVIDMPEDVYHAGPEVSKSQLWTLYKKTPAHVLLQKTTPTPVTPAMEFGRAAHMAVLQPEVFLKKYVRGPENRRGNAWIDAQEKARLEGREVLTEKDFDRVAALAAVVKKEVPGMVAGPGSLTEVSLFWTDKDTGLDCRARLDLIRWGQGGFIVDLKTTHDASLRGVERSSRDHGWALQAAMYQKGWMELSREILDFVFLVVESEPPFSGDLCKLKKEDNWGYSTLMDELLEKYASCQEKNHWPGWMCRGQDQ